MGEAKRRKTQQSPDRLAMLSKAFAVLGIQPAAPGFYNSPEFMAAERQNPELLNTYAEWVVRRPRDDAYDARVREIVPQVATMVGQWLDEEGIKGACLNASTALSMFLERLGIWAFVAKGSVSVGDLQQPHLSVRTWHAIDVLDHVGGFAGHAWVCAPPFIVVDVTLKRQHWREDAEFRDILPEPLLFDSARRVEPRFDDVVSDRMTAQVMSDFGRAGHYCAIPQLRQFIDVFGAWEAEIDRAIVRYVPNAVTASEEPLEGLDRRTLLKTKPITLWREKIKPRFAA